MTYFKYLEEKNLLEQYLGNIIKGLLLDVERGNNSDRKVIIGSTEVAASFRWANSKEGDQFWGRTFRNYRELYLQFKSNKDNVIF